MTTDRLLLNLLDSESELLYNLGKCKNLRFNSHNHVEFATLKILVDLVAVGENRAETDSFFALLEQQSCRNHIQIDACGKVLFFI